MPTRPRKTKTPNPSAKPAGDQTVSDTTRQVDKFIARWQSASGSERADDAIAACFTGRGAWKKRLPQIIDTLVAVGRVRRRKDGLTVIA